MRAIRWDLFHALWGKATTTLEYDKAQWIAFQTALEGIERNYIETVNDLERMRVRMYSQIGPS